MFRCMDPQEIEILQIKELKMIKFYRLMAAENGIPAVAIIYGDNKQLNLSENDEFYDSYLAKVIEIYRKTENKDEIVLDDNTKLFLDSFVGHKNRQESEKLKIFESAESKESPDWFPQGYMDHIFMPIAKYYIGSLYGMFELHLTFRSAENSWHGKGNLLAMRGDSEVHFPYRLYRVSGDEYKIVIGNFFEAGNNLDISIKYSEKGIKVIFDSKLYSMHGVCNYYIDQTTGKMIEDVIINAQGTPLYLNTEEKYMISGQDKNKLYATLEASGLLDFFKDEWEAAIPIRLPWGQIALYSIKNHNGYGKRSNSYITMKNDYVYLRNYNFNHAKDMETGVSFDTSSYIMECYINRKGINRIQVFFEQNDLNQPCSIKSILKNKYFYFTEKIK